MDVLLVLAERCERRVPGAGSAVTHRTGRRSDDVESKAGLWNGGIQEIAFPPPRDLQKRKSEPAPDERGGLIEELAIRAKTNLEDFPRFFPHDEKSPPEAGATDVEPQAFP
jgi:hypothetical protein